MVVSISESSVETEIISGLTSVVGFDVDQDGVIYLSDEILNVLIKLEKKWTQKRETWIEKPEPVLLLLRIRISSIL